MAESSTTPTPSEPRRARVLAVQALCQLEVLGNPFLTRVPEFLHDFEENAEVRRHAQSSIQFTWDSRLEIDRRLTQAAENWQLPRLSPVDRNVLRVAVGELMIGKVPHRVVLNEAIEMAREYGGKDSPGFVNGVLDRLWKTMAGERGSG